jgi:hypothetical protein
VGVVFVGMDYTRRGTLYETSRAVNGR